MTTMLAVAAATAIAAVVAFFTLGGRLYEVRTASMGTSAPPGSLVVTWPVRLDEVRVGDIITFHPPTSPGRTYTHRAVAFDAGRVVTRGDVNAVADPWRIGSGDLVGAAAAVVPGAGYATQLVPIVVVGALLVVAVSRWWITPDYRAAVRLLGVVLVVSFALVRVQPLVSVRATQTVADSAGARFTILSTGLLPVRITTVAHHGTATPTRLTYGTVKEVVVSGQPAGGRYQLTARLFLTRLQRLLVLLVWLVPFLLAVRIAWRPVADPECALPAAA